MARFSLRMKGTFWTMAVVRSRWTLRRGRVRGITKAPAKRAPKVADAAEAFGALNEALAQHDHEAALAQIACYNLFERTLSARARVASCSTSVRSQRVRQVRVMVRHGR